MPSVLITGASRGIGRASALAFAEAGWDLLLLSRSEAALQALSSEIAGLGRRVKFQACDLSDLISASCCLHDDLSLDQELTDSRILVAPHPL